MIVAIIAVFVIAVLIPVGFVMSTAVAAATFGELLGRKAQREGDSELVESNY